MLATVLTTGVRVGVGVGSGVGGGVGIGVGSGVGGQAVEPLLPRNMSVVVIDETSQHRY